RGQGAVALDDLAGDRRIDVRGRLDALDHGEIVALVEGLARFGRLDEDHVAQGVGGVFADAHDGDVALEADPFMTLGAAHLVNLLTLRVCDSSGWRRTAWRRPRPAATGRRPVPKGPSPVAAISSYE